MNDDDRLARAREAAQREQERVRAGREMFDWVSNFYRLQASQADQDILRMERAKADAPDPVERLEPYSASREGSAERIADSGAAGAGWEPARVEPRSDIDASVGSVESSVRLEEFGREQERVRAGREMFDWVSNFYRLQASQADQDILRMERAKADAPDPVERLEPYSASREGSAERIADSGAAGAGWEPARVEPRSDIDASVGSVESSVRLEEFGREQERVRAGREMFDWVSNFYRLQASQADQDILRMERAKADAPDPVERLEPYSASREGSAERIADSGAAGAGWEPARVEPRSDIDASVGSVESSVRLEEFGREQERVRAGREMFDWVSNFYRLQASQADQDILRMERAKADAPDPVERLEPYSASREGSAERIADSGAAGAGWEPARVEPRSDIDASVGSVESSVRLEEFGREQERVRAGREMFDWVSNFYRLQASQADQDILRMERAKADAPDPVERLHLSHGTDQTGYERFGPLSEGRIDVAHSDGSNQDLGQGFYLSLDHETAREYAFVRGWQRGGAMQHVLTFEVPIADLGTIVDIRRGGNFERHWETFLQERPALPGAAPHPGFETNRALFRRAAEQRGIVFDQFLGEIGMQNADTIIAPLGDELFTGVSSQGRVTTQVSIRSQRVADRLNQQIRSGR